MKREQPLKEEIQQPPRKRRRVETDEEDDEKQQEQEEEPAPSEAPQVVVPGSSDEDNDDAQNFEDILERGEEALLLKEGANKHFAPCAVRLIHMKFFRGMTNLKIRPGPGTNFITGPNGSGKSSTLLALYAICGGRPEKIISGTNWEDWIMTDRNEAQVTVIFHRPKSILVPGSGRQFGFKLDSNFKVSLRLRRGKNPQWTLSTNIQNRNRFIHMGQKKISTFMEQLNIRWGNPCQFLPQEKVGQFANMHPKKRFEESLRTFQDGSLVAQHKVLINLRDEIKKHMNNRERFASQLESLEGKKKKMQNRLKECRERRDLMLEKEALEAYKDEMVLRELQNERDEMDELLGGYKKKMTELNAQKQPFITAVHDANEKFQESKLRLKNIRKTLTQSKSVIKSTKERIENNNRTIRLERSKLKDLEKEAESTNDALVEARLALEVLEKDKDRHFNTDREFHRKKMKEFNVKLVELQRKRNKLGDDLKNVRSGIHSAKNLKMAAENIIKNYEAQMKSAKRKVLHNDEVKSLFSIVENLKKMDHFKGEVYGPVGAFIELKDKKFARAVEIKFARKLHKGWLVSCAEDSEALRQLMKANNINKIDIFIQEKSNLPKNYGGDEHFIHQNGGVYMIDTLKAPQMIMDHLIETGWSRSAIFAQSTDLSQYLVKDNTSQNRRYNSKRLSEVFGPNWRHNARTSRYGGHVSVVSGVMRNGYYLVDSSEKQQKNRPERPNDQPIYSGNSGTCTKRNRAEP